MAKNARPNQESNKEPSCVTTTNANAIQSVAKVDSNLCGSRKRKAAAKHVQKVKKKIESHFFASYLKNPNTSYFQISRVCCHLCGLSLPAGDLTNVSDIEGPLCDDCLNKTRQDQTIGGIVDEFCRDFNNDDDVKMDHRKYDDVDTFEESHNGSGDDEPNNAFNRFAASKLADDIMMSSPVNSSIVPHSIQVIPLNLRKNIRFGFNLKIIFRLLLLRLLFPSMLQSFRLLP